MPESAISDELLRFLDANVQSIEQLEILRVLGDKRQWSASDLATECQIQPENIGEKLAILEKRGLVTTELQQQQVLCRYGPRTPQDEALLAQLLQFYKERPVTLIKMVYDRANDRLKAFAEAFRLRKET